MALASDDDRFLLQLDGKVVIVTAPTSTTSNPLTTDATIPPTDPVSVNDSPPHVTTATNYVPLIGASVGLMTWISLLVYLTWTSANPVILSQPLVLQAPVIVEGIWQADGIRIEQVHWGGGAAQRIPFSPELLKQPPSWWPKNRFTTGDRVFVLLNETPASQPPRLYLPLPTETGISTKVIAPFFHVTPHSRWQLDKLLAQRRQTVSS